MKNPYVGNAPFFSALAEPDQERISERMHPELHRSGEVLFRPGDDSAGLYLVKSGWVRLIASGGIVVATEGPGSLVGETDLFLERPRTLGAAVAGDAELLLLTRADLLDLFARSPQMGITLSQVYGSRLPLQDRALVEHRLKAIPFLAGVKDGALMAVAHRLVPVEKKEGEFIVERGQCPQGLFVVESGQVHLLSSDRGGDVSQIGPGETFGEMSLLSGKPHAQTARATTDVLLWSLPAAEFAQLSEEHPDIRLAFSKNIREPLVGQDKSRAAERLAKMPLFSGLAPDVLEAVVGRMTLRHVPAGELVFAEGTPGDALYAIDSGQVEILSSAGGAGTVLARLGADEFFGEMALLTGKPRSSAARAATHCNLWDLHRADFDDLVNRYPSIGLALSRVLSERLADMDRRLNESRVRGIKLLAGLSSSQLEDVSRRLKPVRFHLGEVILREGDPGDEMYLIQSGLVRVTRRGGAERQSHVLAELGDGDVVGEMALLTGNPRSATVTALSEVNAWALSQPDFDELVAAYPNLALALSRLLSERLRVTDTHFVAESALPAIAGAPALPRHAAPTRRAARGAPAAVRREPARSLGTELKETARGFVAWYGSLSGWAKVRLVLLTVLLIWLIGIAIPSLLISSLAAADVTNLDGAVAFIHSGRSLPSVTALAAEVPVAAQVLPPSQPGGQAEGEALRAAQVAVAATPGTDSEAPGSENGLLELAAGVAEAPTEVPPTATPWIIVVTNTPLPPTDTPVPTDTPLPPTPAPLMKAASAPPKPPAPPTPVPRPPRDLDPRLGSLGVQIVEAQGLQPGQSYWRLVRAYWQNQQESGNNHTIYIEVLDENGGRILGQAVEVRWAGGYETVSVEDKPAPEYGANYAMYNLLGSYSVSVPGMPSDAIVGLGLGTAEAPKFAIHTNFLLVFQRSTW